MAAPGIGICRGEFFEALRLALMVVVADKPSVGSSFHKDAVLRDLVPAFDPTLSLWMIRRAARMRHAFIIKIVG